MAADDEVTVQKVVDYGLRVWIGQVFIAVVASVFVLFRRISIPHCELRCDFELLRSAGDIYVLYVGALIVAVGLTLLLVRGLSRATSKRWDWVLPSIGIALTVLGAVIANHVSDVAMLFRARATVLRSFRRSSLSGRGRGSDAPGGAMYTGPRRKCILSACPRTGGARGCEDHPVL